MLFGFLPDRSERLSGGQNVLGHLLAWFTTARTEEQAGVKVTATKSARPGMEMGQWVMDPSRWHNCAVACNFLFLADIKKLLTHSISLIKLLS